MTGCRVGAKNTLDKNYLYLAEKYGAEVRPETEVTGIRPLDGGGYRIETKATFGKRQHGEVTRGPRHPRGRRDGHDAPAPADEGRPAGLPELSDRVGDFVRSNSEALFGVISPEKDANFSKGVAITSILHTDEHSHIEPVRYGAGSGFFRTLLAVMRPDRLFSPESGAR